jgi:hypothetical protein
MFSFLKPKLEFNELPNQERLHKIVEKYLVPTLSKLGFEWTKEQPFDAHSIELVQAEVAVPLSPDQLFHNQYFERNRGGMVDQIIISRDKFEERLVFHCEWEISYLPYEKWHLKKYREEPYWNSICVWSDLDETKTIKKYQKKFQGYNAYDLSRFPANKVMPFFLEQLISICIPQLEQCNSISDAIILLESRNGTDLYPAMFDFCMMDKQYKKAGSILHWAEKNFMHEDPSWKPDQEFNMRLKLLKASL